ncbi:MAG: hypothetical protein ACRCW2_16620 [Cellulosilyticaceae bacterium]
MSMPSITPSNTTRCQALTDIIASIALMEAGISHIINAEGEKIQAILGTGPNPNPNVIATTTDDLLKINASVEKMINSITILESILQKKLSLAQCSCNGTNTDCTCK